MDLFTLAVGALGGYVGPKAVSFLWSTFVTKAKAEEAVVDAKIAEVQASVNDEVKKL